jgi:hydroxyethylthiazole kinase-like uncharacterized protein yjeF
MKIVSPSTMRDMDRIAIEAYKIPGVILMENAGREVALAVKNLWIQQRQNTLTKVALFCGKGNNGGDGFVAARHLANMGFDTIVFIMANPSSIIGDAAINLEIIKNMGLRIKVIDEESDLNEVMDMTRDASILVDAMFGTGLRGNVTGVAQKLIEMINNLEIPVIAVDVPSGICGETGKILGSAVRSKQTVTMALPKTGLLFYPGVEYVGELFTADIGMPMKLIRSIEAEAELLDHEWVYGCFKEYPSDAHKGTFGRVFIIAGSAGMTGAAALSGMASVKSGAGLVTIGVPESLNDILEVKLTEAMTMPLAETPNRCISIAALNKALAFANKCDVVVLGPGLSNEGETQQFVRHFIKSCEVPMIIDADGLNALEECPKILNEAQSPVIITPHPGEMARLCSTTLPKIQEDRVAAVKTAAKEFNCIAVLKGAGTLIADSEGKMWINPTGNAGMATGGSGDVLSGMIGAFVARGMKPYEAAAAGVYIHGLTGDLAAEEQGEICLAAQDLIDYLPKAVKNIKEYHDGK